MIKKVVRIFVIESTSLYLASEFAQGLQFRDGIQSLVITGIALTGGAFLVKPIINILILPINLMTFNFFKWANHAIILFLVDMVLAEFSIANFNFSGLSTKYIELPPLSLDQGILSYLAFSFVISVIAGVIKWIMEK